MNKSFGDFVEAIKKLPTIPMTKEEIEIRDKWSKFRDIYDEEYKFNLTSKAIGCEIGVFVKWIEHQFDKNMNWDNYGKEWKIFHILPKYFYKSQFHNFHNIAVVSVDEEDTTTLKLKFDLFYAHAAEAEKFWLKHTHP